MSSTPRPPLDAEERAMAECLARLGSHAEPSAALDARILASARAAAGAPAGAAASDRRRPQPGWLAPLGIAATLALAVGVAWQLRPDASQQQPYSEAPLVLPASDAASAPLPATDAAEAAAPPPLPAQQVTGRSADAAAEQQAATAEAGEAATNTAEAAPVAPEPAPVRKRAPRPGAMATTQPVEAFEDTATEAEEASAAAAIAFPAQQEAGVGERRLRTPPAATADSGLAVEEPAAVQAAPAPPPPASRAPTTTAKRETAAGQQELDQVIVTGSRTVRDNEGFSDEELDDQPPATADSPKVREAWLRRIRELVAAGEIEAARTNLDEFKRRYPRYALPDDLHALHEAAPEPDMPGDDQPEPPLPADD